MPTGRKISPHSSSSRPPNVFINEEVSSSQVPLTSEGICIANHMRTGEIVDLANERRLSVVVDFTKPGGELLILNGGSRAEEFVVITIVTATSRSERRATYCIDSGTSMQLGLPIHVHERPERITVRIIGGHGEMTLAPPHRPGIGRAAGIRGVATMAAAALLLILAGGRLDAPTALASADPEPAVAEAPLVQPTLSLHVPTHLPNVARSLVPRQTGSRHLAHTAGRRTLAALMPASFLTPRVSAATTPAPRMTDLSVPSTAKSGDFIPVSFGAVAHQVKIVASIGPTIVSKTIVATQRGVIAIRSPKSDLDSRVMTVRAYAQNGNRTATLQAMVILVRP